MIKLTFCACRRDDVSEEEFHDYWLNKHGPLVKSVADVLRIHKYVQSHAIDTPANDALASVRGAPARLDGIAELWFKEEDFNAIGENAEGEAAAKLLIEDEAKFIDFSRSPLWFNQEHVILDRG